MTAVALVVVVMAVSMTTAFGRRQVVDGTSLRQSTRPSAAAGAGGMTRHRGRDLEPPPHSCSEGRRRCLDDVICQELLETSGRVCDQSSEE